MDYAQSTCHNSNGSYGIKVWILEKILKNRIFWFKINLLRQKKIRMQKVRKGRCPRLEFKSDKLTSESV
jgi:ribosomal protein S3